MTSRNSDRAELARRCKGGIAAAALTMALASPALAQTSSKAKEFVYFLPKTSVSVVVGQRLMACPEENEAPEIATTIAITSRSEADPSAKVIIDARSGTFAKRTVKLTLNPDGTLQSFNSESEGQGGKVITAVANAAFKVAPMLLGVGPAFVADARPKPKLVCTAPAATLLQALAKNGADIAAIEGRIVLGTASPGEIALLDQRRVQRSKILGALTLTTESGPIEPVAANGKKPTSHRMDPVEFASWFSGVDGSVDDALNRFEVAGRGGFQLTVQPDGAMYDALQNGAVSLPTKAVPDLIYRRPVPALVTVAPCAARTGVPCKVDKGPNAADATANSAVNLPQLSGLYSIPVGRGGMFGTRQAMAKFDASGAPIALEYGSGGSAGDVAGLIDTASAGVTTLRDAELVELKRQIELEEARKKLADLRAPDTTN